MKEKRFNIGDTVTFKNNFDCVSPSRVNTYYWGGTNRGGLRGVIVRYNDYINDVGCYTIHVSFRENHLYEYMMLESEFLEYNQKQYDGDGIKHKFI